MYSFFSPEEVVRKYFSEFGGSLQNKFHSKALEYSAKVESLRKLVSSFFGLSDIYLVSFQVNEYYIEKLIFNFLKLNRHWIVFTDDLEKKEFKKALKIYSLKQLFGTEELNFNILIWVSTLREIDPELFKKIRYLQDKNPNISFYSFLSLNYLLYTFPSIDPLLRSFSFYLFNPSHILQEYGTVFFIFRKYFELDPVFMGSNASSIDSNRNLKIKSLPHSLEIGTQNLISLIILERFFYFLNKEYKSICSRLISLDLNFNLRKNLKLE